ncbi:MAG TPA: hypothetical protein RMH99_13875, partial [Sandaracinaceae bacterium LLY-WYZ-13_1]|nr:hypothetical protein [Sandaracinaceae bacterium LLY-WYZ-13_1]
ERQERRERRARRRARRRAHRPRVRVVPRIRDHRTFRVPRFRFRPGRVRPRALRILPTERRTVVRGRATGRWSAARLGLGGQCAGFMDPEPQHYFTVTGEIERLRVVVRAPAGAALLVVTPDGQVWCDAGSRARLEGYFPAGTYAVYVGTLQRGTTIDYRLRFRNRAIGNPPPRPAPPPQAADRCRALVLSRGFGPGQARHCAGVPTACAEAVLSRGHHPSTLAHCRGANPVCAEEVLSRGHHPSTLGHCQGVSPVCAREVLSRGHHPSTLGHCQGVAPRCARAVLARGHHPSTLVHCRGVRPACAESLLRRGHPPSALAQCR